VIDSGVMISKYHITLDMKVSHFKSSLGNHLTKNEEELNQSQEKVVDLKKRSHKDVKKLRDKGSKQGGNEYSLE